MAQLGGVKIVWLSTGALNVWAVDNKGQVYLRIGVEPPSKHLLNPAWVHVDGSTQSAGTKFTRVYAGPSDWMVCVNKP
jgi:hypothetical protein